MAMAVGDFGSAAAARASSAAHSSRIVVTRALLGGGHGAWHRLVSRPRARPGSGGSAVGDGCRAVGRDAMNATF